MFRPSLVVLTLLTVCDAPRMPTAAADEKVQVIAHRGNSSQYPENTLAAVNAAFEVGADHVEVDIRLTHDGHAVLMHDETVDRTTNGSGLIAFMRLEEVKRLDAGSWFSAEFVGEPVPTLTETLVVVNGRGQILLDVKGRLMGKAIQAALTEASALTGRPMSGRDVWIWPGPDDDFDTQIDSPRYLLKTLPEPEQWRAPDYFEKLMASGIVGFDVAANSKGLDTRFVESATARGLLFSVYTVNTEAEMRHFIDLGVTGIETDYPARLVKLLSLQDRGSVPIGQQ